MKYSRRDFGCLALLGLPLIAEAAAPTPDHSVMGGIRFGVESFSFHDLARGEPETVIPKMVQYMKRLKLTEMELMHTHIEPFADSPSMRRYVSRDKAREWRTTVSMSYFKEIKQKFDDAGILIWVYDITPDDSFTDLEVDRTFEAAHTLGCSGLGCSSMLTGAERLVPFAEKHQMFVAMHNHNAVCDPNALATVPSLERVLEMSKFFGINLDLGHFTAGNNDTVDFVRRHPYRIPFLHVRDRKRNNGRYMPDGKGNAQIKEVLQLIRDNKYPIRAYIEYEYPSLLPPVEEINNCLEYCRLAVES